MHRLVQEIVNRVDEFAGVRPERLRISATYARSSRKGGLLAYVVPLKFRDGSPIELRVRGRRTYHWGMLPYYVDGVEILYLIYFVLPRFYDLSLKEKLQTVVHELYHIHPSCNGDLRRFRGRSQLHGDLKSYEIKIASLTEGFLNSPHDPEVYTFLNGSFKATDRAFGGIQAPHLPEPRPRLIKVATQPWFFGSKPSP